MHPIHESKLLETRRQFFGRASTGIGIGALATLLGRDAASAAGAQRSPNPLPHFAPKAKRVIYLFQSGGPSHIDLFDYKPELIHRHGQDMPDHLDSRLTTMTAGQEEQLLLRPRTHFKRAESGAYFCDFLPHTASISDRICVVNSMHTEQINHAPATTFFLTGGERPGRPSMGAWLSYGLGSANDNLPTFCVMTSRDREASCGQLFYDYYWGSGFLPSRHQGVQFRGGGDPVLHLSDPPGMRRETRRDLLDDLAALNQRRYEQVQDPEIQTRISQYELAYRMQASVPHLTDVDAEPQHILDMYGPDVRRRGSFAYNCLLARRLAEQGVRFTQLMHAGWDQHQNLPTQLEIQCTDTDQPSAALVKDLEQRGLLEETLVIWGGEFGRTIFCQGDMTADRHGRDHHPRGFSIWMAGGGIKPGFQFGATDEFGFAAVQDPVHTHDFQATILHLLGINHERLTYQHQGRDFRLTDVHGHVVKPILA